MKVHVKSAVELVSEIQDALKAMKEYRLMAELGLMDDETLGMLTREQKTLAARKPRRARDPLRSKVTEVLAQRRADGCTLQDALNDWGQVDAIYGLKLTYKTRGNYLVEDGNACGEDLDHRLYSLRALKKIWTQTAIE